VIFLQHRSSLTRLFRPQTQGVSHLERGQNFEIMLNNVYGALPANQTIDYVAGISHNDEGMMDSDQGIDKVRALNTVFF
jgi:hypothetical protein